MIPYILKRKPRKQIDTNSVYAIKESGFNSLLWPPPQNRAGGWIENFNSA